jgi:hypothetical protein
MEESTFVNQHRRWDDQLRVPALALPISKKEDFCWPSQQEDVMRGLNPEEVTRVLTIGWRGLEDHFLPLFRPLITRNARMLVVNLDGSEAEDVANHLAGHIPGIIGNTVNPAPNGFGELLRLRSPELKWLMEG